MTLPPTATRACASTDRPPRNRLLWLAVAVLPVAYVLAVLTTTSGLADDAHPNRPHSPIGRVDMVRATDEGTVRLSGWAADPDRVARPVTVYAVIDGAIKIRMRTSLARPRVSKIRHVNRAPGFRMTVALRTGRHTVCVAVQNIGPGMSSVLRCVTASVRRTAWQPSEYNDVSIAGLTPSSPTAGLYATRLVPSLSAKQLSRHDPRGALISAAVSDGTAHLTGWARDPDFVDHRVVGDVEVDGVNAATFVTRLAGRSARRLGAGRLGRIDASVPIGPGTHVLCVHLHNLGLGGATAAGCRSVSAPYAGGDASGWTTLAMPAVNHAVVTEALRHLGQPYVWATQGPATFDCSGLVLFSYAHAGLSVPRIAADQYAAAHAIPVARAVPGDLVFYHDAKGYVYHVGIYLGPGRSVAAIDPAEGVDYQPITDPTATYGSFTHT